MVGRPFSIAVLGGGKDGVVTMVNEYKKELYKIMLLTGAKSIKDIKRDMVELPANFNEIYETSIKM
jgi:isopentenyl diphosphate isomerase/L-lactate dehydrogenase-like FMN-dependent dehydrogenase